MRKIFTSLILSLGLVASRADALSIEDKIYKPTAEDVKKADKSFALPIWTKVAIIKGNDELDPRHANKVRATFLAHHENKDDKKHYVVIWNHGMHGFRNFSSNTYPFLKWLYENKKSFTWIAPELPWSNNVNNIEGRTSWSKKDSFKTFVKSAMDATPLMTVGIQPNKELIFVVAGHSRGGKSIRDAAKHGGLCDILPSWVIWSDSSYSKWLDTAWDACLGNSPVRMEVFYMRGTETQASAKRMQAKGNPLVEFYPLTSPWYHGKIGSSVIMMSEAFR